jgi:LytS/YehU family sensor histidine kinase
MFTLNFYLLKPFSRQRDMKLSNIITAVILSSLSVVLLVLVFNSIKPFIGFERDSRNHHDELLLRNFFSAALVLGSIFIMRLIFKKQTYELEIEKLRSESLESQFESLKNNLSPHFLFNTLSGINTLIRKSPDIAEEYVNHLSQVLRYTLQSNKKKTVSLGEEIEFTGSYLFLIEMRYGQNLKINTVIQELYLQMELPPLTLQTLVENAVKHNEISIKKPLTIFIETTENAELVIRNQVQNKLTQEDGTGLGLTNLSRQFQLLGEREVRILQEDNEFKVIIPLIKPSGS